MDRRVLGGAGWMLLVRFAIRGIGMISTLILARLLTPNDFGLVAMATSIIALIDLLRAFSFDVVLIQRVDAQRVHYDTVWTLKILFGLLIALLVYGAAGPAADFYQDARLEGVIGVLAVSIVLGSFENVGVVNFRKEFNFRREFDFMLLRKVFGFAVTIPLAFVWRNYWALVAGMLAASIGAVVTSYVMHPYRPRFGLGAVREILSFSVWMQINNILLFTRGRSIDFIVGRLVGAHGLGVLTMAMEISSLLTSEILQPINRALFPGYAKLDRTSGAIAAAYLSIVGGIALFVVPVGVGLALVARDLVPVVLGSKWSDAVAPIQVLAIYSLLVALQGNNLTVFVALGRTRLVTILAAISVTIAVPLLIVFTYQGGVLGACYGLLAAVLLMAPINVSVVKHVLGFEAAALTKLVWRPAVGGVMMAGVCVLLQHVMPAESVVQQAIRLGVTVAIGGAVYVVTVAALWTKVGRPSGAERFIFDQLTKRAATE